MGASLDLLDWRPDHRWTCGPLHGNSICGSWSGGACCSSAGFCGSDDDHCGDSCISGPCNSSTHSEGASGDVFIDPGIWSTAFESAVINCIPPCVYILPPLTLGSTTTITFPLYTTSLEVAWWTTKVTTLSNGQLSTSTGIERTTETTTLTIPPVTTDKINLWNVNVTSGVQSSVIYIISSISPHPFTITDDRNSRSQSGVTHPIVVRTITPPPYPYTVDVEPTPAVSTHPSGGNPSNQGTHSGSTTGTHSGGPSITGAPAISVAGSHTPYRHITHSSETPKHPFKVG